jgi:hypothetical protein
MGCPDCDRLTALMEHTLAEIRAELDAMLIRAVMRRVPVPGGGTREE